MRLGLLLLLGRGGNAQGGLSNAPSLNRPVSIDDMGHDVISNGPEACRPTAEKPGGPGLPQCPEAASSARPAGPARPPAPQHPTPPHSPTPTKTTPQPPHP